MTAPAEIQDGVRFIPSKVEGVPGNVVEAFVFTDRLELVGDQGRTTIPFDSFTTRPSPPSVFRRLVGGGPTRPHVAVLSFARGHYPDSFIRFLTPQPVTLYMPAEGPTRFPDSVFARVLRTLHAGGYGVRDVGAPPPKSEAYDLLPRGARAVVDGIMFVCAANFIAMVVLTFAFRGNALLGGHIQDGHYYLAQKARPPREVSRQVWEISWWQTAVTFAALPTLLVAGIVTERLGKRPQIKP